jgi:hypothetical protein
MDDETVVFTRKTSRLFRELGCWEVLLFMLARPAASVITYYTVKAPGCL